MKREFKSIRVWRTVTTVWTTTRWSKRWRIKTRVSWNLRLGIKLGWSMQVHSPWDSWRIVDLQVGIPQHRKFEMPAEIRLVLWIQIDRYRKTRDVFYTFVRRHSYDSGELCDTRDCGSIDTVRRSVRLSRIPIECSNTTLDETQVRGMWLWAIPWWISSRVSRIDTNRSLWKHGTMRNFHRIGKNLESDLIEKLYPGHGFINGIYCLYSSLKTPSHIAIRCLRRRSWFSHLSTSRRGSRRSTSRRGSWRWGFL